MEITPYIVLLQKLVQTSSLSGQEEGTAALIDSFLAEQQIKTERLRNNVIARNKHFDTTLPTLILNSHHDTVAIGSGWSRDPLGGELAAGRLYGRGSNDAGGALIALLATFCHYYEASLPFNLIYIASAEEENFGPNGVSAVLKSLDVQPSFAIIGEPTGMNLAIAEKGLIVIDALTRGKSGHAAREEGINALYMATSDIEWIKSLEWDRKSDVLGVTKTTVTQIDAGNLHNVIPSECHYTIDCRVNECYTLEEVVAILNDGTKATLTPRSLKWRPSSTPTEHPFVKKAASMGRILYGSPTLSDQVHFECPTVKIGPGQSSRSHTPDEFIFLDEVAEGINIYIALLKDLNLT